MIDFMREGGFMMWPLALVGLVAIAAETRRVATLAEGIVDGKKLARAVLVGAIGWTACGLSASLQPEELALPVKVIGIGESMCPLALGCGLWALVAMIGSITPRRVVA